MNATELTKLAKDVAICLGTEWTGSYQELYGWKNVAQVARSDGAALSLWPTKDGRVEIMGQLPGQSRLYESNRKTITVSLSRGPEVIVKEIKRRLLDFYLATYTKAVLDNKREEEEKAACSRALDELAAVIKEPVEKDGIYFSRPKPPSLRDYEWRDCLRGSVKVSSGSNGELEITSCPISLLSKLLQVINNYSEAVG